MMKNKKDYLEKINEVGLKIFGSKDEFDKWMDTQNFYFDNHKPNTFMNTISELKFLLDNLVAIEYGDNA